MPAVAGQFACVPILTHEKQFLSLKKFPCFNSRSGGYPRLALFVNDLLHHILADGSIGECTWVTIML